MGKWGEGRRKVLNLGGKWKLLCRKNQKGGGGGGRHRVGEAETQITPEGILYCQVPVLGRK